MKQTIRTRMIIFFGSTSMILIIIAGLFLTFIVNRTIFKSTYSHVTEVARARSEELQIQLEGYIRELDIIAQQQAVKGGNKNEAGTFLASVSGNLNPDFEDIIFADKEGNFISNLGATGNVKEREYFNKIMKEGCDTYVNDPIISKATGSYIFSVAKAVKSREGETVGVISAAISLSYYSDICETIHISNQGYGWLVDGNGNVMAYPDKDLIMKLNADTAESLGFSGFKNLIHAFKQDNTGYAELEKPDGGKEVVIFSRIDNTPDWTLCISVYKGFLTEQASTLMHGIIGILIASIFLVGIFVYIYSHIIAKPIIMASNYIYEVAQGNYNKRFPEGYSIKEAETAALISSIKKMQEALVNYMEERKTYERNIEELAYVDSITKLPNKNDLYRYLETILQPISSETEYVKTCGILFSLDFDSFKFINDTYGYAFGDKILGYIAECLKECFYPKYYIAHFGGNEFIIIANGMTDTEKAKELCTKIHNLFGSIICMDNIKIALSVNIGIACYPIHGISTDDILKNANTAMNMAKQQGKARAAFFEKSMNEYYKEKMDFGAKLREAMFNGEFELYYQPQIELSTGKIYGFEGLLRWRNPKSGLVMPGQFIPICEETGLIVPLGLRALEMACFMLEEFYKLKWNTYRISVNISAIQILQLDFVTAIQEVLDKHSQVKRSIDFELTESALMDNYEENNAKIHSLLLNGTNFMLDDFGTGYSSIGYLNRLPFKIIKIDRSFIMEVHNNENQYKIVKAIIGMAHDLGFKVIAEGVEIKEQLLVLKELQCDMIQGYYVSRPISAEEVKSFIENYKISSGIE